MRQLGERKWLIRVSCGRDPFSGKRSQPSKIIHGSRRDAERALVLFHAEHLEPQPGMITLSQLFERWIEAPTRSLVQRAATTKYHERNRFNRYVRGCLGNSLARDVTSVDLTVFYDRLRSEAQLSPMSIRHVHAMIRRMYNWGRNRGLVGENPTYGAEAPSVVQYAPQVPDSDVLRRHLAILNGSYSVLAIAVLLDVTFGLRRSEIAGLRWCHLDLGLRRISIREGVTRVPGCGLTVTQTKTGHQGFADFIIPEQLLESLRWHREYQEKLCADAGVEFPVGGYVLWSDPLTGEGLRPDSLTQAMRRHCMQHPELPRVTFKQLRSFVYSSLRELGFEDMTASAILRDQPETTARHYAGASQRRVSFALQSHADAILKSPD
jgi:integrase